MMQETRRATQSETARPLLISVETLAEMLDISPRSVWRRLSSGEMIEPIRIGSSVRWRLRDVEAWVEAGCPTPVSEWNGR
jgi:predicted DNA-binding transcriptional regulator AlpA